MADDDAGAGSAVSGSAGAGSAGAGSAAESAGRRRGRALEVALIDVTDGTQEAFVADYAKARQIITASPGCGAVRLTHGVETPTRFVLLVEWESIALHDQFRASERFGQWRALIGPHFAGPPHVEHFTDV